MNQEIIARIVHEHGGMLFDFEQDGQCVLDRTGQRVMHLVPTQPRNDADVEHGLQNIVDTLTAFFSFPSGEGSSAESLASPDGPAAQGKNQERCCDCYSMPKDPKAGAAEKVTVSVNLPVELLLAEGLRSTLRGLLSGLAQEHLVRAMIWFDRPPVSWEATLSPLVSEFLDSKAVSWSLVGPLARMPECEKKYLYSCNANLLFGRGGLASLESEDAEIVQELAEFGFRVPVLWFVTKQNVSRIREQIDHWMDINYNSGFALPLISHHPFVEKKMVQELLPSAREYLALLVETYQQYPDYDEVFFPLTSYAARSYYGNWNDSLSVPRHLELRADAHEGLSLCSQTSWQRTPWTSWESLGAMGIDQIANSLFACYRETVSSQLHSTCQRCPWKGLCGGAVVGGSTDDRREAALVCEVTRFFLRFFLWQRVKVYQAASAQISDGAAVKANRNSEQRGEHGEDGPVRD